MSPAHDDRIKLAVVIDKAGHVLATTALDQPEDPSVPTLRMVPTDPDHELYEVDVEPAVGELAPDDLHRHLEELLSQRPI